jgi:glutaredoxin
MNIRIVLCLLASLASGLSQAEVYTWKDAQGRTHFGDRPPPESAPTRVELKINTIHRPEILDLDTGLSDDRQVVIYTADWCGVCRQAKGYFERKRIPYKEYNVETSTRGRRDFERLDGTGVPIVLVGNRRMNGFSAERFEQLYQRP